MAFAMHLDNIASEYRIKAMYLEKNKMFYNSEQRKLIIVIKVIIIIIIRSV
jgi:hypothetical protein